MCGISLVARLAVIDLSARTASRVRCNSDQMVRDKAPHYQCIEEPSLSENVHTFV
jgi:hypothetical protein